MTTVSAENPTPDQIVKHARTFKDITGQRFGRLLVVAYETTRRQAMWRCRCDCGQEIVVSGSNLRAGGTVSCKCLRREKTAAALTAHGQARKGNETPEYSCWCGIKKRCTNPKASEWENYGGRGITICEAWGEFANFYADMGPKPSPRHTIDRYPDNDGNYSCGKCPECTAKGWPKNCRWATQSEQQNNRRSNLVLEFRGKRQTVVQWSREIGIGEFTLYCRIKRGWSVEETLTVPVVRPNRRKRHA